MFRRRMIGLLASVALAVTGAGVMALPASAAAPPMPMVATVESVAAAMPGAGMLPRATVASVGNCQPVKTVPVGPGSTGPAVSYLQCLLNSMHFGDSWTALGPTGKFGDLTAKAVRAFKLYAFGTASDSIVGPTTWTMLVITATAKDFTREWYQPTWLGCPAAAHPTLTQGSRGAPVVMLQCMLNAIIGDRLERPLEVDGIFGLRTWNAVIRLKALWGLPHSDGIVGPGMWDMLLWSCQCGGG